MNIHTATGKDLDAIGESLAPQVKRSQVARYVPSSIGAGIGYTDIFPEGDESYRNRILSQKNGGPAFGEFQQAGSSSIKTCGMTLRDYFAAKVMQAIVIGNNAEECTMGAGCAADAYTLADAMLAERAK